MWLEEYVNNPHILATLATFVCMEVQDSLEAEELTKPPGSLHGTRKRNPWRREGVFAFEVYWSKYFVREARLMDDWPTLTARQREERINKTAHHIIPFELQIILRKKMNEHRIREWWQEWEKIQRAWMQKYESVEENQVASQDDTDMGEASADA